jgi:hypothetical protein
MTIGHVVYRVVIKPVYGSTLVKYIDVVAEDESDAKHAVTQLLVDDSMYHITVELIKYLED